MNAPDISVVVPVRSAEHTAVTTLEDLLAKCRSLNAEVIAVVSGDDPTADLIRRKTDPQLRVIVRPGRHSVPQLRREGVLASQARLISITEDHCLFPQGWVERQIRVLDGGSFHVCGGGVDNERLSWTGWAQYFTRYCAFLPPGREGPAAVLPGNNACYLGSVLRENSGLMQEGFWEAELNHELMRRKYRFWWAPELAVRQRQQRGLLEYAFLRFRHGNCFAARKAEKASAGARLWGALKSPLVPLVLYLRAARAVRSHKRYIAPFAASTPLLLVYFASWSLGEFAGWLFGGDCVDTD